MIISSEVIQTAHRIAAADLAEMLTAQQALGDARAEATRLLDSARAEAATLIDSARQSVATDRAEMERQIQNLRTRTLGQTAAEVAALRIVETSDIATRLTARFDALTPWVGELVFGAMTRLIGALEPDERLHRMLVQAVSAARRDWELHLRCHPESVPALQALLDRDATGPGRLQAVKGIVEDDTLSPEDCLLECVDGLIEIGLSAQIAQLRLALGLEIPDQPHPAWPLALDCTP